MNYSGLLKFAGCILLAGAGGGLLMQRFTRKRYEKELSEIKTAHYDDMEELKDKLKEDLHAASMVSVRNAFSEVVCDDIRKRTEEELNATDIHATVEASVHAFVGKVCKDAKDELVSRARNDLMKVMTGLAKDTVEAYVKEDMYKVNTRRIVEDAVYRITPTYSCDSGVLGKLSGDNLQRILEDPWASDRLIDLLKATK